MIYGNTKLWIWHKVVLLNIYMRELIKINGV